MATDTERTLGPHELIIGDTARGERIQSALLQTVVNALGEDEPLRKQIIGWSHAEPGTSLERGDMEGAAAKLETLAHDRKTELGKVGRLPSLSSGRIVGDDSNEFLTPISSWVVLALALRRFALLTSPAARVGIASGHVNNGTAP